MLIIFLMVSNVETKPKLCNIEFSPGFCMGLLNNKHHMNSEEKSWTSYPLNDTFLYKVKDT